MAGAGPMHITDNRLVSEGQAQRLTDPIATTALVADFGLSNGWTLGLLMALVYRLHIYVTMPANHRLMNWPSRLEPAT